VKYWAKIYEEAVAHGTAALAAKNIEEAKKANAIANFAGKNACLTKPNAAHVALNASLEKLAVEVEVDDYFAKLDDALKTKQVTKEEFDKYEKDACKQLDEMRVTRNRCAKYRTK
jgi:hypothetical protein